jgi:hypothetical protein
MGMRCMDEHSDGTNAIGICECIPVAMAKEFADI